MTLLTQPCPASPVPGGKLSAAPGGPGEVFSLALFTASPGEETGDVGLEGRAAAAQEPTTQGRQLRAEQTLPTPRPRLPHGERARELRGNQKQIIFGIIALQPQ